MKTFPLDAAMTAAPQLTEGGREGREKGERELKRKSGVFSVFDMQATGGSQQQLDDRERGGGKERERSRERSLKLLACSSGSQRQCNMGCGRHFKSSKQFKGH